MIEGNLRRLIRNLRRLCARMKTPPEIRDEKGGDLSNPLKKLVRLAGLEPARVAPLPPQSSVSANSTISAAAFNKTVRSAFGKGIFENQALSFAPGRGQRANTVWRGTACSGQRRF